MEGNRDEADRCIEIAINAITEGKLERAEKFLNKAERLFPTKKAQDLLAKVKTIPTNSDNKDDIPSQSEEVHKRKTRSNSGNKSDSDTKNEPDYSIEQLEAVKNVKKCKDYYQVLGVTKEATDSEIKKSYKKLALLLHPDKNKAPGAIEAFKAVGNAVAILTDPEKRKSYDLHGGEHDIFNSSSGHGGTTRRHYTNEFAYTRGFESEVTAEELFNMFFGTGFPQQQQHVFMRQRRFHNRAENNHHQQPQSSYTALINLLPIILLIGLSMMSSFFISDPIYSLQPSQKYVIQRRTNTLKISYYVKDNFHSEYQGSVGRLEASVEDEYVNHLRHTCVRERNYRDSMMAKARTFGDRDLYRKAQFINTPSCDTLQKLLSVQ